MVTSFLHEPTTLFILMLAVIFLSPLLEKLTHLPRIIGLILGGFLIGPHGLNLVTLNPTVELLGSIGLIYLMFNVGLEINLEQFASYRNHTIIFYLLTYLIPQLSGILLGVLFGLSISSSILLGAIYASYTLVAYPIVSELGILKNEAVAVTISATVLSDITALLVLTIIIHLQHGNSSLVGLSKLGLIIILFTVFLLKIMPQIVRLYFHFVTDKKIGFIFILFVLFTSAIIANVIGIQAITGAFLAGIAVNRMISKESGVIKQTLFTGESLFVPFFLITVGMRLNFADFLTNANIILIGLGLTMAVYITKLIAAWITAYLFDYTHQEMLTIWGLSQAQAAATIAILLIGVQANLFPEFILHSAIIMILFTLLSSPYLVKHYGASLKPIANKHKTRLIFKRILVAVDREKLPKEILEFTARIARYVEGKLIILNLAENNAHLQKRREKLRAGPGKDPNTEVEIVNRIENDIPEGILKESLESEASFIMMNWIKEDHKKGLIFSADIDKIIWSAKMPVAAVLLKVPIKTLKRIVTIIGSHTMGAKLGDQFLALVSDIKEALDLPLLTVATPYYRKRIVSNFRHLTNNNSELIIPSDKIIDSVVDNGNEDDLIIIPSMNVRSRFGTKSNLIPYNILNKSKGSLMIVNFP